MITKIRHLSHVLNYLSLVNHRLFSAQHSSELAVATRTSKLWLADCNLPLGHEAEKERLS